MRHFGGEAVEIYSAGSEPSDVHPIAIEMLEEWGIDTIRHYAKSMDVFIGEDFDYVITVCDRVRDSCPTFPNNPRQIHWSFPDNEYLFEDRPDSSLERLLDMVEQDVMVCGHTHIPYHRVLPSGRRVVNAGSVGKLKDGDPRACYVILEAEGDNFSLEFIRVEYDVERTAQVIVATDMPDEYATMLREGCHSLSSS